MVETFVLYRLTGVEMYRAVDPTIRWDVIKNTYHIELQGNSVGNGPNRAVVSAPRCVYKNSISYSFSIVESFIY